MIYKSTHYNEPARTNVMLASVASGVAGATIVKRSPGANAEVPVNVALVAAAAKTIVPTCTPFFPIVNVEVPVAATPDFPKLPKNEAPKAIVLARTTFTSTWLAVGADTDCPEMS